MFRRSSRPPGGLPFAAAIFLEESDISTIASPVDPACPVQWVAVARNSSGQPSGGIRHQFRDELRGFVARLTAEFPAATLRHVVRAHRWHLACEFSNWIAAANAVA